MKEYFATQNIAFDPKYNQILQLAGLNAEETFLIAQFCVENSKMNIDNIVEEYYKKRLNELNTIHQKFLREEFSNDPNRRYLFYEVLTYMDTDFELPFNLRNIYDKKIDVY